MRRLQASNPAVLRCQSMMLINSSQSRMRKCPCRWIDNDPVFKDCQFFLFHPYETFQTCRHSCCLFITHIFLNSAFKIIIKHKMIFNVKSFLDIRNVQESRGMFIYVNVCEVFFRRLLSIWSRYMGTSLGTLLGFGQRYQHDPTLYATSHYVPKDSYSKSRV